MKYFSIFLISCLFICLCVGCIDQNNYPNNIDLLYSKSYENFNDFDEPIEVIDTYDDYISSGYPLGLEKDYFNDKLLYTYTFYHYVMGSDIFLYHSDEITDDILFIYYEINIDVEVLDAEGSYALIFGIDKDLFHSVVDVQVKELKDSNEKIEMLYSGSYLNYHDFEEPVQWVCC